MPCVSGIRLNRPLECLEIFLRLRSSEALGKFVLALFESSVSLWGIVFPRVSESYFPGSRKQKGWTRKTMFVPLGYDTYLKIDRYTLQPLHKLTQSSPDWI